MLNIIHYILLCYVLYEQNLKSQKNSPKISVRRRSLIVLCSACRVLRALDDHFEKTRSVNEYSLISKDTENHKEI